MAFLSRCIRATALFVGLLLAPLAFAGVNVNTASQTQLESLPGIGPSKAQAIIEHRTNKGTFKSLQDLDAVPGIGKATLEKLSSHVVFDGESTSVPKGTSSKSQSQSKPASSTGTININTAGQAELQSLPGIGPSKAVAIIQERQDNGPFSSCGDITRVKGVGKSTAANMASRCTTD